MRMNAEARIINGRESGIRMSETRSLADLVLLPLLVLSPLLGLVPVPNPNPAADAPSPASGQAVGCILPTAPPPSRRPWLTVLFLAGFSVHHRRPLGSIR